MHMENATDTKVLYIASECVPFVSSGGLGDVIGSLPAALCTLGGYDIRVCLPLYGNISAEYREQMTFLGDITVPLAWRRQYCGIYELTHGGVKYYFLDNEYYFKRAFMYGEFDDAERFAFFSRAALEFLQFVEFCPDILHCHDWQSALSAIYLREKYALMPFYGGIKSIITIHNIQYQGEYGTELLTDVFDIPAADGALLDYCGNINLLKGAIVCADRITTVSPTYASEIMTPAYSHGLDHALKANAHKLSGILNGIDTIRYNPAKDKGIDANFSYIKPEGKKLCKEKLLETTSLPYDGSPAAAIISRLVSHKGLDLMKESAEEMVAKGLILIVLGQGEKIYEDFFRSLGEQHPDRVRVILGYDRALAQKIYAGADIFLMPSQSEPCGLAQMIASRYGAVPVVHETGGLYDTIKDIGWPDGGNGFTFSAYNAQELKNAVWRAVELYKNTDEWEKLVKKVMRMDFSWRMPAVKYDELYQSLVAKGEIKE